MNEKKIGGITQLLAMHREGDERALAKLVPLVQERLRYIAEKALRGKPEGGSLTPTVLLNETFARLVKDQAVIVENRQEFFAVAARCMRAILAEVRARRTKKSGGQWLVVTFMGKVKRPGSGIDLVVLDAGFTKLEKEYPELVPVVELRYLAGLSIEETALALHITPKEADRKWELARAWLSRELQAREVRDAG